MIKNIEYILIVNFLEERFKVRLDGSTKLKASDLVSSIDSILSLKSKEDEINVYVPSKNTFMNLSDTFFEGMDDIGTTLGKRIVCEISQRSEDYSCGNHKMIAGRVFNLDDDGFKVSGRTLIVREQSNSKVNGTGLNIWDGSILLARYLEYNSNIIVGKTVLELGCGPGIGGISAAIIGASEVVLTDLQYSLQLASENVILNMDSIQSSGCKRIEVHECDWFCPPLVETFNFSSIYPQTILIADCVWVEELVEPLLVTLAKFSREGVYVVIAYQRRGKAAHDRFFNGIHHIFNTIQIIPPDFIQQDDIPETFSIVICII